jgi:hypothetical protein
MVICAVVGLTAAKFKALTFQKPNTSEGGRKSILLECTQAMPARLSDKDRMGVKTLEWWVVKLETETAEFSSMIHY